MTFGAVIDVLAAIGAGTCVYWAIRGLGRLLRPISQPFSRIRAFGRTPVFRRAMREKSLPPGEAPGAAAGSRPDEHL